MISELFFITLKYIRCAPKNVSMLPKNEYAAKCEYIPRK